MVRGGAGAGAGAGESPAGLPCVGIQRLTSGTNQAAGRTTQCLFLAQNRNGKQ